MPSAESVVAATVDAVFGECFDILSGVSTAARTDRQPNCRRTILLRRSLNGIIRKKIRDTNEKKNGSQVMAKVKPNTLSWLCVVAATSNPYQPATAKAIAIAIAALDLFINA